jgi:hypothetical protein
MLYSKHYASHLSFSEDYIKAANTFRTLRNLIHFPLAGASEAVIKEGSYSVTEAHETIMKEWKDVLHPLYLQLVTTHSFNFHQDVNL